MISEEKIKSIDYLFNRIISERLRDSMEPKYSLLLGAGCSISSEIASANSVVNMLKSIAFMREMPVEDEKNPFWKFEYGEMVGFLEQWYEEHQNDEDFIQFVGSHREKIIKKISNVQEFDKYYEEVFHTLIPDVESNYEYLDAHQKHLILEKILNDYKNEIISDMEYSYWFEQYSAASEDIHSFLTELMNNKNPSKSYIYLADLFINHMFSIAFTTNFDNLLGEALSLLGVRSKEILFDTNMVDNTLSKVAPNIIKLHGDYMYNNTKNLSDETRELSEALCYQMESILRKGGLIVVGYLGADNSIMNILEKLSEKYTFPLFWCELESKVKKGALHWRVKKLLESSKNSYLVPIKDFDDLVEQLRTKYIFYAKMREAKSDGKNSKFGERFYNEDYLKKSLDRIKILLDNVNIKNEEISKKAVPVPPPDFDTILQE